MGWELKKKAGKKKVILELGGNAARDRRRAIRPGSSTTSSTGLAFGAFYQSGQSCIGVQRILVHASIYDALREKLIAKTKSLVMGDPKDEKTFVGPMISESESRAARRLDGKRRCRRARRSSRAEGVDGAMFEATLLESVKRDTGSLSQGSVRARRRFWSVSTDFEAALATVNDSDFGLQAGVFTDSASRMRTARGTNCEVGGVVINDVPSFRVDNMPYGGVKDSGLGARASATRSRT